MKALVGWHCRTDNEEETEEVDERLKVWAMCVHGRGAVLQRYMQ